MIEMTTPVEVSSTAPIPVMDRGLSTTRRSPTFPSTPDALPGEMHSSLAFVPRGDEDRSIRGRCPLR